MTDQTPLLSPRGDRAAIENGDLLMPAFDAAGLITAVTVRANTGEVLMVAHMNREALERTLETRQAWYWSRSRGALWLKGETSGQLQHVREIRVDCDQDCLLLVVDVGGDGGCCHTGEPDCFYRRIELPEDRDGPVRLVALRPR